MADVVFVGSRGGVTMPLEMLVRRQSTDTIQRLLQGMSSYVDQAHLGSSKGSKSCKKETFDKIKRTEEVMVVMLWK